MGGPKAPQSPQESVTALRHDLCGRFEKITGGMAYSRKCFTRLKWSHFASTQL